MKLRPKSTPPDTSTLEQFKLTVIGKGFADFLLVSESKDLASKQSYKLRGTVKKQQDALLDNNRKGFAAFMMVNTSDGDGTKDANVIAVNAVFIDYDGDAWANLTTAELLEKFELKPHIIVKSSPGHYHVYWLVTEFPLVDFVATQKVLAAKFDSDPKVCNLARVMRLPGTENLKGPKPFRVKMVHLDKSLARYTKDEVIHGLSLITQPQPCTKPVQSKPLVATQHITDHGEHHRPNDEEIRGLLAAIPADDRDVWVKVGMGLHAGLGEDGRELFIEWSGTSPKFDLNEANRQWQSFNNQRVDGITLGTVRFLAEKHQRSISAVTMAPVTFFDLPSMLLYQVGETIKYAPYQKHWYTYVNGIWHTASSFAEGVVREFLQRFITQQPKHHLVAKCASAAGISELLRLACTDSRFHITPEVFDATPEIIGVRCLASMGNYEIKTLDLRSGAVRPSLPTDYLTKTVGVQYDPQAPCPRFMSFLDEISDGDIEMVEALQIAFGYALFGHVREQVMFVLIGNGSNGKGVLLNVMRHVCGDYATTISYTLIKKHSTNPNAATPALAPLAGSRLVSCSEFDKSDKLEESLIKNITGADTISYRANYGEQSSFTPVSKIFLTTNNFPKIAFDNDAMWRRLFPIHMTKQFKDRNRILDLEEQIKSEGSGILNWLIHGAVKYYQQGGLLWPDASRRYLASLRKDSDTVGNWLKDCCRMDDDGIATSKTAYDSYKLHAKNNNSLAITSKEFKAVLQAKGVRAKRRSDANIFVGIVIND